MKNLCFFLSLVLIPFYPLASKGLNLDSLKAVKWKALAEESVLNADFVCAKEFQQLALNQFYCIDDLASWINTYKYIGRTYSDDRNDYEEAIQHFLLATKPWRKPNTKKEWEALAWLYVNLGYMHAIQLGRFKEAVPYYEKAVQIFKYEVKEEDDNVGKYVYRELANIYTRLGDYEPAEVLQKKFRKISLDYQQYFRAAEACIDLSIIYLSKGEYDKAKKICQEALEYKDLKNGTQGLLYLKIAKAFYGQSELDEAISYVDKALSYLRKSVRGEEFYKSKVWLSSALTDMAQYESELGRYKIAHQNLSEALSLLEDHYPTRNRREFSKQYNEIGHLFLKEEKIDSAIHYFLNGLPFILPEFNPQSKYDLPSVEDFYSEVTIGESLALLAKAFGKRYEQTNSLKDLNHALVCHEYLFEIEKVLRINYQYETSKLLNIAESRARSEEAVLLAIKNWKLTNQEQFKRKAFTFAERSKSLLLVESHRKSNAIAGANVSQQSLKEEQTYLDLLANAEKQLFMAMTGKHEENKIQELKDQVFSIRQEYNDWVEALENKNPKYFDLKYNYQVADVEMCQSELGQDEGIVEYFVGEENIFIFLILKEDFQLIHLAKPEHFENSILNLRNAIERFQNLSYNKDELCTSYQKEGHYLYKLLWQPLESYDLPEKISIIPSSSLGNLPFSALLTQPVNHCNYKNYPYLLKSYEISYGFSVTHLSALKREKNPKGKYVGFAPRFDGSNDYEPLLYNIQSLEEIHQKLGGEVYLHNKANIDTLKIVVERSGILHLATHAKANLSKGDYSFIVFSDGNEGYDTLFARDIYLIKLSGMVVLSACETGIGKLEEGEGIISLARAFLYAGASSVVTTIWSINDQANSHLMEKFYDQLTKGKTQSEALRHAKLEQLESGSHFNAHPVFWASFKPIGAMKSVDFGFGQTDWLWVSAVIIALFLGLRLFYRVQRRPFDRKVMQIKARYRQKVSA